MKDLVGVLFTSVLIISAFHYGSMLLGVAAIVMTLIMIGRFDKE